MTAGNFDRRSILNGMIAAGVGGVVAPTLAHSSVNVAASAGANAVADMGDDFWEHIASQYDVTDAVIQLENGNWGMMSRPVLEAYKAQVERVNRDNSYYARRGMGADLAIMRKKLADFLQVEPEEIALTRNATEALKALIGGYNQIGKGDAALYADLDYGSMQASMDAAMARRGAEIIRIALPEPATYDNILAAYKEAFDANPNIKLVLLTHISHRTGLMLPVRAIADMARERGIDVIVDAAHSLGQADFTLPELGADFIGINLHKWIGAPLGVGAAYIRKNRIEAIDPDIADENKNSGRIDSRIHTGTVDFAAALTLPAALEFQSRIGASRRAARLQDLRNRWVQQVRNVAGIEILTPDDPRMYAGITSFRLRGKGSVEDNKALAALLLDRYRIFTVHRDGVAQGACVRGTPALFNLLTDMDALAKALQEIVRK